MQAKPDAELLREYAECGAEAAFGELVQRHTNLVYSAAFRQVESADIAAEIAQNVFIGLARGAGRLAPKLGREASLAGWLCRCAHHLSLNHRRDEFRRLTRERHAMEQLTTGSDDPPNWEQVRRVLDDAMAELGEADYDALVLRFFQNRDFRAVGAAIGVSDDTAQKRVSRALDKLRARLAERGIRTSSGALGIVVAANAVQAAPAGLAATISGAALAGAAATSSTVLAATKTILMTTLQKSLVTAAAAVLAGAGVYEAHQAAQLRGQIQTARQEQGAQLQDLQTRLTEATNRLADLLAENSRLRANPHEVELLRLRDEVNRLKSPESDPTALAAKDWLSKVQKLRQHLAAAPGGAIPEIQLLDDQDWLSATKNKLESENDYRKALSVLRNEAENKLAGQFLKPALHAFAKENDGRFPQDLDQLRQYVPSPLDEAIWQRWEIVPAATVPNVRVGD